MLFQYGDIDYMEAKKSFTYDKNLYAGLPEYVDQLHDWGMRWVFSHFFTIIFY